MKHLLHSLVALIAAFALQQTATAGSYQGYVLNIFAVGGKVIVTFTNGSGASSCPNPSFFLDPSVAYDKAMLTLALTAKTTTSLVYADGSSTCETGWPYSGSQQLTALNMM